MDFIMKKKYFLMNLLFLLSMNLFGQEAFNGIILDYENKPIVGAIVLTFQSKIKMVTDSYGKFRIDIGHKDTLKISSMGYQPLIIAIGDLQSNTIKLEKYSEELQEVIVSTGYYEISQERSTGSFTHIDNQLLNRNTSTNILDRLEGITNGLTFNRRNSTFPSDESGIQIRGISTIHSNSQPLIVVDDFHYVGDI
jgi:hypothetical protein